MTVAIVFAAVSISAALVFLGVQLRQPSETKTSMDETQLGEKIAIGIEQYVQKQQEARRQAQSQARLSASDKAKNVRRVSATRDHVRGNPQATISLIEYSDFECPFCKRFHPTAKKIVAAYGGKVNWVYRHFPLIFHNPGAQKQAEASECAAELGGNQAFWRYADLIFERTSSGGKGFPLENLTPLAKEIGLDEKKFQECFDSGRYTARVKEDFNEGVQIGVTGTPGNVLLNNETGAVRLAVGARPFAEMKAEIDQLLDQGG